MIPWWRTTFGEPELARLTDAMAHEHIGQGPVTEALEQALASALGVPYAVVTTSGSAALVIALIAAGVDRDDEVVMPNRTWVATAHAVLLIGSRVKLVDVTRDRPVIDPVGIEAVCSSRTRVIMPVHLNGRASDMTAIDAIARKRGLVVIEDACQALFSRSGGAFLGTQSAIGCFSLGMTKVISTGQGGFCVTRDRELYEKLKLARNHGVVDQFTDRWNHLGFNFKFTDLLSSFGLAQLERVEARLEHLKRIYTLYGNALRALPFLTQVPVDLAGGEVPLYAEMLCPVRDRLIALLKARGIQTRPVPPNLSSARYIDASRSFPNSELFASQGFYLPCGPEQPLENVERVIDVLGELSGEVLSA